jgi:hypothetical protein
MPMFLSFLLKFSPKEKFCIQSKVP